MIETPARVLRLEGDTAWVRIEAPASCGACGGKGCGNSLYARLLHSREPEYPVANPIRAEVGESVTIGIEDGAVLRAVAAGYGLPLTLLLTGAMVGAHWGEPYAVAGVVAGLFLSALWLRRHRGTAVPVILRRGAAACSAH